LQASKKAKRKIPERKCIGCGEGKSKQELLRIVRSPDMTVSVDKTGKKAGRGAYICPNAECLKKARKSHRLEKNLACEISNEIYDAIEAEFVKNE